MAIKFFSGQSVAGKIFSIGFIVVLLMIPLTLLKGLISERSSMRAQAYDTVANGWGGRLTTGGPILRVPFNTSRKDKDGEVTTERHQLYVLPTALFIDAVIEQESEPRHVGIYKVPVYHVKLKLRGSFDAKALHDAATYKGEYLWEQTRLRLPLSDVRAVRELTAARFGGQALKFAPAEPGIYSAIEANVDVQKANDEKFDFVVDIKLAGSQALSLLPLAAITDVKVHSTWPDPQFEGAFLPAERTITKEGFTASWQVLELNRAYRQSWIDAQVDDAQILASSFGVELFQSVDVYQQSERAVKYALMFIALTFLSFYAWELLSATPMHPIQYLFIGLALSAFYLLLIALSEHIPFAAAYWLGAAALVALLGTYIAGALANRSKGAIVATVMTLVYGLLYMLVLSESYALLMGAIALFVVLAIVMLATRKIKWYATRSE